jgi:hypothetical protein
VGSGSGADAGVADLCGGVVFLLFAACSTRAAARAGNFLFFSMAAAGWRRYAKHAMDRHTLIGVEKVFSEGLTLYLAANRGSIE